jgi:hypothetical protein
MIIKDTRLYQDNEGNIENKYMKQEIEYKMKYQEYGYKIKIDEAIRRFSIF